MKKITALLFSIVFSLTLLAYPISPRPLRKLITESQYIVWGKVLEVGSVKETKKNKDVWERDFAVIAVQEKLQGKLTADTVKVFFCSGMICPSPGVFYENEEVLAFLDKKEKGDGFYVHALSYGVKHGLSPQEYGFYKERITEMQVMIANEHEIKCSPQLISWLIKCAEHSSTRWDGLYELSPQSDFMSFYDRGELACKETYLTTNLRKKLFDVLISIDTLNYSDLALVDITTGVNDSLLLDFLKSRLLRVDTTYYWPADDIMNRIAALTGSEELAALSKKFSDVKYSYKEEEKEQAKNIFKEFINKMQTVGLKNKKGVSGNYNVFTIETLPGNKYFAG